MSRTTKEIPMKTKTVDDIITIFKNEMDMNGFSEKLVNGERVWAKGDGVLMCMQCFAITFKENSFVIQGWFKEIVRGETELKGMAGFMQKKKMRSIMSEIENMV